MSFTSLQDHEEEIGRIVTDVIKETFKSYFSINVTPADLATAMTQREDLVICEAVMHEDEAEGALYLSFDREALIRLAKIVYPPDVAQNREAFESCATEIANIVTIRVKNYLNDQGYNLKMDIPAIADMPANLTKSIHFLFSVEDKDLLVDVTFEDRKKASGTVQ